MTERGDGRGDITARQFRRGGIPGAVVILLLASVGGCVSFSYTATGGGSDNQDASGCIELQIDSVFDETEITNTCDEDVNFVAYRTGDGELLLIPANDSVVQAEIITAWGACIAPDVPQRTGDFEYDCAEP